jgi:hypothetical protein
MATIQRIEVDYRDERVTTEPFVRASLEGGCDVPECRCSSHPFISVSDGRTVLAVTLDPEDVAAITSGRAVELDPDVV